MTRPLIVVGAGTAWDGVPGTDRRMATELLRYAQVLWIDPEFSVVTKRELRQGAGRRLRPTMDEPAPGLHRLMPIAPPLHSRPRIRPVNRILLRTQVESALRRLGRRPYAVLDCRLGRLLSRWEPGVRRVLYGTDDYVGGAELMGLDAGRVRRDELICLADADLVLAVSPLLAERWRGLGARDVRLLPNGVSALPVVEAGDPGLPRPVAGVVGQLSDRIDIGLLEALADRGISLLLVGPRDPRWEPGRFELLIARPHVRWTDRQPHESLPGWFAQMDVGVTPYVKSDFNRASFPLKTLEYLAAGLPVVTTDLPATRWLDTGLVTIADEPSSFADAVHQVAGPRPDLVAARRAFAAGHSWQARGEVLATALGLLPSRTEETPSWQS
ncbi:glycosyltransferase [Paractinoplanes hotanensis]|uniref:Glycosyltransferase n=1 Tax=Paractinoplanes hotanensis TaxID=2906497 RepID=A0ABT0YI02_9ACTN|nr:glycosyltransferase [Actinoplanes hotanensis]MCM4084874.1 glycosyltransferase [Actinoplanes hotanensis]